MEFVPSNLANGVAATSPTTVFTVPANATAMMRSILLVNKSASEVNVTVKVRIGASGSELNVVPPGMKMRAYTKYDDNSVISLPENSLIIVSASAATSIDFIISGVIAS